MVEQQVDKKKSTMMMAEVGPRLVLNPIKMLDSGFCGPTLYEVMKWNSDKLNYRLHVLHKHLYIYIYK